MEEARDLITFLAIAIVLVAVLWAVGRLQRVKPGVAARVVKSGGGLAVLTFALFLLIRGQLDLALGLGAFGLGLLGWSQFDRWTTRAAPSHLQSRFIELEIDQSGGIVRGRVLAGCHQGVPLDALDANALAAMLPDIDDDSRALLIAYLDRRHPRWREHANSNPAAGRAASSSGKMTDEEAYQILGVQPGASAADISRAHRSLMKKLHPDQGGSTYLAARVNEAKEILSRRHR